MRVCPSCGSEMEFIESDETEWWECPECGIEDKGDDDEF